jgi:hypothetical protein
MNNDLCKLASAAIIYRQMQKEAFVGDLLGMLSRLMGLPSIWSGLQNWASQRDDVSRLQNLPPPPPDPVNITARYNPFSHRMVQNERTT